MRTVGFDLDGVVMQGPFAAGVGPRIRAHLSRSPALAGLAPAEVERRVGAAVREAHARRLAAGGFVAAWDWDAIYAEVAEGFGGQPTPDVAGLVRECCGLDGMVALLPGVGRALERLRAAGIHLVAITNGYHAYQWPVLEALGVAPLFDAVITPDVAGAAKPDPRIFRWGPGLAAHVGDTLEHDVLGAKLAGIRSVWLDPQLPAAFRGREPADRPAAPAFPGYLAERLARSAYRAYHPEASVERCTPDAVVVGASEAAALLLGWLARPDGWAGPAR